MSTECAVCGTDDDPEKGWIYKSKDVAPVGVEGGEVVFEARDDAGAICSIDCLDEYNTEQEEQ